MAMRESASSDLYILARVALEAAIRNEIDLLELLPDVPVRKAEPVTAPAFA